VPPLALRLMVVLSGVNYFFGSATTISPDRVASTKNVTELLVVVGGRLQGFSDILRRQLVRLETVW